MCERIGEQINFQSKTGMISKSSVKYLGSIRWVRESLPRFSNYLFSKVVERTRMNIILMSKQQVNKALVCLSVFSTGRP